MLRRVAGMHPLPSATAFLWSHLLCNIAVLFTRNLAKTRTKKKQKKTITCPEQLISVSCISTLAKILPYTETVRRGLRKPSQGLGLCLHTEIKAEMDSDFLQGAGLFTV